MYSYMYVNKYMCMTYRSSQHLRRAQEVPHDQEVVVKVGDEQLAVQTIDIFQHS